MDGGVVVVTDISAVGGGVNRSKAAEAVDRVKLKARLNGKHVCVLRVCVSSGVKANLTTVGQLKATLIAMYGLPAQQAMNILFDGDSCRDLAETLLDLDMSEDDMLDVKVREGMSVCVCMCVVIV